MSRCSPPPPRSGWTTSPNSWARLSGCGRCLGIWLSIAGDDEDVAARKKKLGNCVYGGSLAVDEDHVPPKNLFPKDQRHGLVKVPSCRRCNGGASQDDEYFRSRLIPRKDVAPHPQA